MKDDKTFGLYLRVMAAGEDPLEAAKMVTGKDGKLTDTGAEVLQWIPIAAKIFTVILNSQSDGGKAQWKFVRGRNLFPWLLCGMDPKKAADVLLKMGEYKTYESTTYLAANIKSFIKFMRFSPEVTTRILANMPEDAIEFIFTESVGTESPATLARITPFLKKFNPPLAAQLFPENLQDMLKRTRCATNIFVSRFFGVELKEIISVFQSSEKGRIMNILERMISGSDAAQAQEVVQILKTLLLSGSLDYKEVINFIKNSVCSTSITSNEYFNSNTLHYALMHNFSDDMFARIVCHMQRLDQNQFLETLPEERRKAIQNLIETTGAEEP
jgi:hypothetical protein